MLNFVDLFSGCGGLSLGLMQAGIELTSAVEKSEMAAETYHYNLIRNAKISWEEFQSLDASEQVEFGLVLGDVRKVLKDQSTLRKLKKAKVSILVGGPPCQGYSVSGKRDRNDVRNSMSRFFLRFVDELQPQFIIVENVHGMRVSFSGIGLDNEFSELAWKN